MELKMKHSSIFWVIARAACLFLCASVGGRPALAAKPGGGGGGGSTGPRFQMTLLGTLGGGYSAVWGMNERGDVVGASDISIAPGTPNPAGILQRAFVNLADSAAPGSRLMINLDEWVRDPDDFIQGGPRWLIRTAHAINDNRQVAATAFAIDPEGKPIFKVDNQPIYATLRVTLPRTTADGFLPGFVEVVIDDLFVYDAGSLTSIRMNNQGDMAGMVFLDQYRAFLWTQGTPQFYLLGGKSPQGITARDDDGVLALAVHTENGIVMRRRVQVTQDDQGAPVIDDLQTDDLTALYSNPRPFEAADINEREQIVGTGSSSANDRAFRFDPQTGMKNLGALPPVVRKNNSTMSNANGMNNLGHVVGRSREISWQTSVPAQPFLYIDSIGMVNLRSQIANFDQVKLSLGQQTGDGYDYALNPRDINDAGQICGPCVSNWYGFTGQAWILTPLP